MNLNRLPKIFIIRLYLIELIESFREYGRLATSICIRHRNVHYALLELFKCDISLQCPLERLHHL